MPLFARWPVLAIALAEAVVLLLGAGGYGYHRDELYFIEAGHHPAFGYDDQPPLAASSAMFLGHLLSTATFDFLAWAVVLFLFVRLLREPTRGGLPAGGPGRQGVSVENEEQGAPISVCAGPRRPWRELWPRLHHLSA